MEDKDFLSYFWKISQYPNKELKFTAARNIVQTLLTLESIKQSGNRKLSGDNLATKTTILQKYTNNDYGENISPDLNYTLSRLIKGMTSENNAAKEGFFITFSLLIARFPFINPMSLLKTIVRETSLKQAGGKHEVKCIKTGRVLLLSVIGKLVMTYKDKEEYIAEYTKVLLEFYKNNAWLQELIGKTLFDFIEVIREQPKLLEKLVRVLGDYMGIGKDYKLPQFMANNTSLIIFFAIKRIQKLLGKKSCAFLLRDTTKNEVKAFLGSAKIDSLVLDKYADFLVNSKKANDKLVYLWKEIILPKLKNEELAEHFKCISFLFLSKIFTAKKRIKLDTISQLLSDGYCKIWAKAIHSSEKSITRLMATEVEREFQEFIKSEPDSDYKATTALNYLEGMFGPDPQQHFTPTRHSVLYKILVMSLKEEHIKAYLNFLKSKKYEKKGMNDKETSLYPFTQFTSLLNISDVLTEELVKKQLTYLTNKIIKDKGKKFNKELMQVLYTAIRILNKRTGSVELGGETRGFTKEGELWIKVVHDIIAEAGSNQETRVEAVKLADNIKKTRKKIESSISEVGEKHPSKKRRPSADAIEARNYEIEEKKVSRLKNIRNIALSFEKLILNLAIFLFTEDEEYESIKELQECYENLDIIEETIMIKAGKSEDSSERKKNKKEALEVYVDFLVELLTRSHAFVREIGNFAFQQIAGVITEESLENLLSIITTPNTKASQMISPIERIEEVDYEETKQEYKKQSIRNEEEEDEEEEDEKEEENEEMEEENSESMSEEEPPKKATKSKTKASVKLDRKRKKALNKL